MKKILLLCLFLINNIAFGQSPRVILIEEFTSATCPPSATNDPVLDTLIWANSDKVISLKYQGPPWPSSDVMYNHNPTDVNARSTYYSVPYVPYARIDGAVPGPSNPNLIDINQSLIDSRYAVMSPFTINVIDSLNVSGDSVFITIDIHCTQNVSMINPYLRISLVEKEIHFATAPGGTSQKDFYMVMLKMIPDALGTTLGTTWTTGQTQQYTFAVPVPSYIYSRAQIQTIAWIQDDFSFEVMQAGYSTITHNYVDAGITGITDATTTFCDSIVAPIVSLKNFGQDTLSSATIMYSIDGVSFTSMPWSGNLLTGQEELVVLPSFSGDGKLNVDFICKTELPNGQLDWNDQNNQHIESFLVPDSDFAINYLAEGFEGSVFPPSDLSIQNKELNETWEHYTLTGAFGTSNKCTRMEFYNIPDGIDYLYLPLFDFTGMVNMHLTFDVAYAPYNASIFDTLAVEVSVDCGVTWTTQYFKSGSVLATSGPKTSAFVPLAIEWRTENVDLFAYDGNSDVMIRYVAYSDWGNNLYIDNINVSFGLKADNEVLTNEIINVYPNPFSEFIGIDLPGSLNEKGILKFQLFDVAGKNIINCNVTTNRIDLTGHLFNAGIYEYRIMNGDELVSRGKLIGQ